MFKKISYGFLTFFLAIYATLYAQPAQASRFRLCADDRHGYDWTNNTGGTRIRIETYGNWTGGGENPLHDANGTSREPEYRERLIAPQFNVGALLMRRSNGRYEFVGRGGDFRIREGEIVNFVFNDYPDAYGNNEGCLDLVIE